MFNLMIRQVQAQRANVNFRGSNFLLITLSWPLIRKYEKNVAIFFGGGDEFDEKTRSAEYSHRHVSACGSIFRILCRLCAGFNDSALLHMAQARTLPTSQMNITRKVRVNSLDQKIFRDLRKKGNQASLRNTK